MYFCTNLVSTPKVATLLPPGSMAMWARARIGGPVGSVLRQELSPVQAKLPLVGTAQNHGHLDAPDRGGDLGAILRSFSRRLPTVALARHQGSKLGSVVCGVS